MSERTLAQWLTYIQCVHFRSIDMTLARARSVSDALAIKPAALLFSVAGTNGKGSCVAMLEAVLTAAGLKTGAYTSPHLVSYNERIRINGSPVSDEMICQAFAEIEIARGETPLTYFEFSTLAAMRVFHGNDIEACVLEVGMGGRLDAVNIYDPDIAIVTSIGVDHTQWLGEDEETIAREKAGIFRSGKPAICGDEDPPKSLRQVADEVGAKLFCQGQDFEFHGDLDNQNKWSWSSAQKTLRFNHLRKLPLPGIPGRVQQLNAATVVTALAQPIVPGKVDAQALKTGLARTRLAGRLHHITSPHHIIFDVSHNAEAVNVLCGYLTSLKQYDSIRIVYGMLADKPIAEVVGMLGSLEKPKVVAWYVAALNDARGLPAKQLAEQVKIAAGDASVAPFASPVQAFGAAVAGAPDTTLTLVFGSFITVGDILAHLQISPFD